MWADKGGDRCGTKNRLGLAVILLATLALGGCFPDRGKDMAACQMEADRFYQTYNAINPDDPSSRYIIGCMAAKGYDFTILPVDCNSQHPLPTQQECYEPNSWIGWFIEQFRRALELIRRA